MAVFLRVEGAKSARVRAGWQMGSWGADCTSFKCLDAETETGDAGHVTGYLSRIDFPPASPLQTTAPQT
jgi:hypothetical protein